MQNWLKMESSKSSVVVLPTISPTALTAMRKSSATSSSDQVRAQRLDRPQRRLARAAQRVLMPRVDHHLQHSGPNLARPRPDSLIASFNASIPCPLKQQTSTAGDE